jgi:regulator of protease activity HflC (stomatin/prohibitin superfamily)
LFGWKFKFEALGWITIMEYSPTPMFGEISFLLAFAVVLAIVVLAAILMCVKIVKQGECMVIERFGKYHSTLDAGLNIIIPVMDRPRPIHQRIFRKDTDGNVCVKNIKSSTIDLREQVYHFAKENMTTKDNENIQIDAKLYFQICDPRNAVYEIANLPDALEDLYITNLRNAVGNLDLNECLASREKISSELSQFMDEATDKWGVKVSRLGIKDIVPTPNI